MKLSEPLLMGWFYELEEKLDLDLGIDSSSFENDFISFSMSEIKASNQTKSVEYISGFAVYDTVYTPIDLFSQYLLSLFQLKQHTCETET